MDIFLLVELYRKVSVLFVTVFVAQSLWERHIPNSDSSVFAWSDSAPGRMLLQRSKWNWDQGPRAWVPVNQQLVPRAAGVCSDTRWQSAVCMCTRVIVCVCVLAQETNARHAQWPSVCVRCWIGTHLGHLRKPPHPMVPVTLIWRSEGTAGNLLAP